MINISLEPNLGGPFENCVFCLSTSKYWSAEKDVPVCAKCATKYEEKHVPSKENWISGNYTIPKL